jgi:hypothetical protein
LAQQPAPTPQQPRSQLPDLGRPTKQDDQVPPFNFETYFVGKWNFEWDVPAGPLGDSGTITGMTTYTKINDMFFEAVTEGKGPSGPIKVREVFGYNKDLKAVTRQVTDSRGFSFLELGRVGGDLGGYFTIHLEGSPFTHGKQTLRFKHTMYLLSPVNYKVTTTLSVDNGPFRSYGNPWWRKDMPSAPSR